MRNTPSRLSAGGGSRKTHPSVVSDGTASTYEMSVNKSEKRTPATTASQTGCLRQHHRGVGPSTAPGLLARPPHNRPPWPARAAQQRDVETHRSDSIEDPEPQ